MTYIWALQGGVTLIASVVLLGVKIFAFVDALARRPEAFVATGKMTKPAWLLILGLSAVAALLFPQPIGFLSIIGTVASFVYLLDVRPAIVEVTRRR
jgi:hypothetical protein